MGNVPIVVCYEYIRALRVYNEDIGAFTLIPAVIRMHEVYIDGLSCKGVKSFSDWQLDKWEEEIDNVESPVKPFVEQLGVQP